MIAITADTPSDIPERFLKGFDIRLIPLTVTIDGKKYLDREELPPYDFYELLKKSNGMPVTSPVSPISYVNTFTDLLKNHDEIFHIGLNSKGSESLKSAEIAAGTVNPDKITVFDSLSYSMGYGLQVLEAARMAKAGSGRKEIASRLENVRDRMRILFAVDTFEYLRRGKRIGAATALVGTLLDRKPVLTLDDGIVTPAGTARGRKGVIGKILEIMQSQVGSGMNGQVVAVGHGHNPEGAEELAEAIRKEFSPKDIIISEVGSVIGTHAGPGVMGTFYLAG